VKAGERLQRFGAAAETRLRHLVLATLAAGLALAGAPPEAAAVAGAAGAVALLAAGAPRVAVACLAGLLGGLALGHPRLEAIDSPGERLVPGARVAARAHLLTPPRQGPFGASAEIRVVSAGNAAGARLVARFPLWAPLPESARTGAELAIAGRVRRPPPRGRTRFDVAAHHRRRGIAGELAVSEFRATGATRGGVAGAIDSARERAERALESSLPGSEAALARGMVLGQDERIDPAVIDDFRDSGLAHLLAVSGQNVMLLAALALPLLAVAGLPRAARLAGTIALIAVYVPLAGAGPSLQRAGVMGAAGLAALLLSRPASRWYALLLAACATLALNPRATGDPGWQLSFAAVVGILLLAPSISRRLTALPRLLADGIAVTAAATLSTAPLLAHHFGTVPAAGLPANLVALPLVAPIMWLGIVRAGLGQATVLGGPAAVLTGAGNEAAAAALEPLVGALGAIAAAFAQLPGGQVALPVGSRAGVLIAYAALAAGLLVIRRLLSRVDPEPAIAVWRRIPAGRRRAGAATAGALVALALAALLAPPRAPTALTVSFLDVGQGDATLVQHPDGSAVLFDTGPPEGRVARLLRRAGVRRLSALVLTHASRDHHGGAAEVVRRMPVDVLVDGGDGTADRDFRAAAAAAAHAGARRVVATAPRELRAGGIAIRILSPRRRPPGPAPEDPNPRAVVAIVRAAGFDLLLSADAESPALLPLVLPRVDAIKVPHHGSADPGLADVLRRLRPRVAAIEVGRNSYGHPAPETLDALREAGVRTFRTDRHGTVRLRPGSGGLTVETER
jgi:competence protein ComEC